MSVLVHVLVRACQCAHAWYAPARAVVCVFACKPRQGDHVIRSSGSNLSNLVFGLRDDLQTDADARSTPHAHSACPLRMPTPHGHSACPR